MTSRSNSLTPVSDVRPAGRARSRKAESPARRAARLLARLGTAVVLGGAGVAAVSRWGGGSWSAAWTVVCVGAGLGTLGGVLRLVLGSGRTQVDRGDLFVALVLNALPWVTAAAFAAGVSGWRLEHGQDVRATLRVPATVTGCWYDGDAGPQCTYHWQVEGRVHTHRAGAPKVWPDGHRTTVRVDPANPNAQGVVGSAYRALWLPILLGALGTPLTLAMAFVEERHLTED